MAHVAIIASKPAEAPELSLTRRNAPHPAAAAAARLASQPAPQGKPRPDTGGGGCVLAVRPTTGRAVPVVLRQDGYRFALSEPARAALAAAATRRRDRSAG